MLNHLSIKPKLCNQNFIRTTLYMNHFHRLRILIIIQLCDNGLVIFHLGNKNIKVFNF